MRCERKPPTVNVEGIGAALEILFLGAVEYDGAFAGCGARAAVVRQRRPFGLRHGRPQHYQRQARGCLHDEAHPAHQIPLAHHALLRARACLVCAPGASCAGGAHEVAGVPRFTHAVQCARACGPCSRGDRGAIIAFPHVTPCCECSLGTGNTRKRREQSGLLVAVEASAGVWIIRVGSSVFVATLATHPGDTTR